MKTLVYNILFCTAVAVLFLAIWHFMPAGTSHHLGKDLNGFNSKAVDMIGEMNKYLTAIALGIIAILGNILIGQTKLSYQGTRLTGAFFLAAMLLGLCSLFFGFLTYSTLFENVSNSFFDAGDVRVNYAQSGQFYTLIGAAIIFIWYIINTYFNAIKKTL